ncbi:hypothetical protein GA0070610_3983 [Micromonospora echinofusca]|uniref:Flagellar basal body-associated protein FliL n=1 Tax=Micromonospora echinofusca TaxID=47858 RepID=A0A1C5GCV6_MICEH|nr:hypothetical protein [Micromonospora echinofusca]SCG17663.1 hypothetical protein GA0070610_3983 [Micromonospora echinofusca]
MSQPPVDPWSGQPEHDTHYDFHPPRPDGYPAPPDGGWTPPPGGQHPSGGQPSPGAGWPATPHPGPAPTQPYPGPPPAQPHPTQPYGGYPVTPQAGFPTRPYAGYAPPAQGAGRPARPHQLMLTLGLVGLLVLCIGGGGIAYLAYEDDQGADPRPTPSASPTAAASSATPSAATSSEAAPSPESSDPPQIRVVTPETLAGRPKSTEPTLRKAADDMVRELRASVRGETGVAGAFYGSADERNMVMVIAAASFVLNPERELDDTIKGISKNLAVTKMTTIAPGPQGGLAKCGDGESAGVPLGVCAWADHGSVGMIVMFFSSAAASAAEFVAIRGQIEQKY